MSPACSQPTAALPITAPARPTRRSFALRVNVAWSLSGQIVYTLCQLGIVVVLAKLGTEEMVGQFALALAIASPVMIFAGLSSLRIVQATDAKGEHHFHDYLGLRLITSAAGLLLCGAIAFFLELPGYTEAIVFAVGIAKAFENLSDVFGGFVQQHERIKLLALSGILRGVVSLGAIVLGVWLSGSLLIGVGLMALGWALCLLLWDMRMAALVLREDSAQPPASLWRLRWDGPALRRLATLALPVVIAAALVSLTTNIPRYFIEQHLGLSLLGIFAAMAYPMAAGTTLINAIGQSAMPRLARHYAEGDYDTLRLLLVKLAGIAAGLGLLGVAFIAVAGRPLLVLLYRPEYAEYGNVFLWLGIGTAIFLVSGLLGYGMNAVRYFRAQLLVAIAVALVATAACVVLIPRYQLVGAAVAIAIASAFQLLANAAVIVVALRRKPAR